MPKSFQIQISDSEKQKLMARIENDMLLAKASHMAYAERCAGWMKKWQSRVSTPAVGEEHKANNNVPLIQWQVFNKLARDMQALLGDAAEITAHPTGPSDAAKVAKVGAYMTSRVFDQMKITVPLCEFLFRRILFGWAAAYRPWWRDGFTTLENGRPVTVSNYEGPGFFPLEPDDLVIPNERGVKCIQDFSWVLRRYRVTVDELQRGDGALYQGTSGPDFLKRAIDWAQQGPTNDYTLVGQDPVRTERERTELVAYDAYMPGRRSLWVWEWFGGWRPLKKQARDAEINDLEKRLPYESDYVIRCIPGMREIVGVQDLLELYPKMRRRRPFVESTLIKDGTYRPQGYGALLEDLEDEATANSHLGVDAGELSVWPIIFFKPGGGMKPGALKLGPGMGIPTEDPSSVNVVNIRPNLDYVLARQQDILSLAERVTGITDQSLGRAIDRPNAPRTATGQVALLSEGNVRNSLDMMVLKEDMEQIIEDFWHLDCNMVPQTDTGLFFRVTEGRAAGLLDVRQGGAYMTPKEFGGTYDFSIKFATNVYARQFKKQEMLAFYTLAMQNPLIATNPTALWMLTNKLAKDFGVEDFAAIVPQPPELDRPKQPDEEWNDALEGEQIAVNPQDHDDAHILAHQQQLEDERQNPSRDVQAIGLMVKHVLDHQQQKRTKMLMASLTSQLAQSIMPQQQNVQPSDIQQLQQLQQMYGGGPQQQPAPPQPSAAPPMPGMPPGAGLRPGQIPGQGGFQPAPGEGPM